jgi:DNA mismatch repair protein MutS2
LKCGDAVVEGDRSGLLFMGALKGVYGKLTAMDQKTLTTLEYPRILNALADLCHFNPAREQALDLHPLNDLEAVRSLQRETAEALDLLTLHPATTIGGARDLRPITADARRGKVLEATSLLEVKDTLVASRNLARMMSKLEGDYPSLSRLSAELPDAQGLINEITKVVSDQGEILDSASPKLANIRKDLVIRRTRLRTRMESILRSPEVSKYLQEAIITQRNGRYVVPLKAEARSSLLGIVHDQSASGATIYIEPQSMVEANNLYRQLELDERDEIHRILAELTARVAEHAEELDNLVDTLTKIDLALARGRYALALNAIEPKLHPFPKKIPEGHPGVVLRLYSARHPLLKGEGVVPIDVALDEETYGLIITGPNTGGKTVTLKTVGLLALMAQTGLHIPAAGKSEISLFSSIYADIGDEQSIEQSLSTFSGHITNIIAILEKMDRRSLVILDELGAGTDPQEGAALARSLMSYLLERGITTLVTTHHPDLKAFAHATPGVVNASVEFDLKSLRPTYHLTIGLPGRSNALAIASRLGLPDDIIQAARGTLDPADLRADDLLDEIHRQRHLAEEARVAAEGARDDAERLRRQLADRIDEVETERLDLLEETRKEARENLDKVRAELIAIRSEVDKGAVPDDEIDQLEEQVSDLEEELSEPVPRKRKDLPLPEPHGPLQEGDQVYLRSLGKNGQVLGIDGEDVELMVGNIRVRARKSDLEYISQPESSRVDVAQQTLVRTPEQAESPGLELDLRGQQVDEALENLGYFLDRAFLARLPWARIIHGMGTGRLRSAVRKALQSYPQVSHFEAGKEGEGGDGVTVVSFED